MKLDSDSSPLIVWGHTSQTNFHQIFNSIPVNILIFSVFIKRLASFHITLWRDSPCHPYRRAGWIYLSTFWDIDPIDEWPKIENQTSLWSLTPIDLAPVEIPASGPILKNTWRAKRCRFVRRLFVTCPSSRWPWKSLPTPRYSYFAPSWSYRETLSMWSKSISRRTGSLIKQEGKGPIDFRAIGQWETASDVIVASKWPQEPHLALIWPWIWNEQSWLPWNPCTCCLYETLWWPLRPWRPLSDQGGGHFWPWIWVAWPQ